MEYTHLGRSGVAVSRLCLGTMNFGAITGEADAQPIMDAAHEHGINFFDTSGVAFRRVSRREVGTPGRVCHSPGVLTRGAQPATVPVFEYVFECQATTRRIPAAG